MEPQGIVARASATIHAPAAKVWKALTDPAQIKEYMFGAKVQSDWKEGSAISWKGEWKGKTYEDKGRILQLEEEQLLQYSHYSPLSGMPDEPGSYHTVTVKLEGEGNETKVSLEQDNNASDEERQHSEENWKAMLDGIRKLTEEK